MDYWKRKRKMNDNKEGVTYNALTELLATLGVDLESAAAERALDALVAIVGKAYAEGYKDGMAEGALAAERQS
jgi:hypothetical protein